MKIFDLRNLPLPQAQALLQSAVAPRPIALASTVDADGNVNLSPFSFFNVFGTNPPTLIFAPNRRMRDATQKHTFENVSETEEVVIHMVDYAIVEQMSLSSCEYPKGTNEFEKAGFTPLPSIMVAPPRIKEAKIAFECITKQIITMGEQGGAANLVICEVVLMHIDESILNEQDQIEPRKTDWVARSGGSMYVRAHESAMFEIPKPTVNLGVGVDQVPLHLQRYFTGNELGRLGNIAQIPTQKEVASYKSSKGSDFDFVHNTKELLKQQDLKQAWLSLLSITA